MPQKADSLTKNRTSETKQKDSPQKGVLLRKMSLNRKTTTQTGDWKPDRKTLSRKESHREKCPSTGRLKLKLVNENLTEGSPTGRLKPKQEIRNQTERRAPERRAPNSKMCPSLRKVCPDRKTKT